MCITSSDIAALAVQSLIEEVETTPKPGLVDLISNGSHHDLTVPLFRKSALSLTPYFEAFVHLGMRWHGDIQELFPEVRTVGKAAEEAMFQATDNINTHKGALFSLGVLTTVAGYAMGNDLQARPRRLCALSSKMTSPTLRREIEVLKCRQPVSHGEKMLHRYGDEGVRGEVMRGFPSVLRYALPSYERREEQSDNQRNVTVLLSLMAHVTDTNVLSRGGRQSLLYVQRTAEGILAIDYGKESMLFSKLERLDEEFIKRNLSSGGVADLLSVTLFLKKLEAKLC